MANDKKKVHLQDAEDFEQPVQITRTKIIDDKIVIDRRNRKMVVVYRTGNIDADGNFVDQEEDRMVFRGQDFDTQLARILNNEKLFFAAVRSEAKSHTVNKRKK